MPESIDALTAVLADRYTIERELGQGGMATVYLAQDIKHDRRVAIKVLRPELASVLGPDRFLKEIKVTANLQHPHILPLFDSGEANSFPFYVMPFVEGESLADKVRREKQLSVEESLEITNRWRRHCITRTGMAWSTDPIQFRVQAASRSSESVWARQWSSVERNPTAIGSAAICRLESAYAVA